MTTDEEITYVTNIAKQIRRGGDTRGVTLGDLINEGWIALQEAKPSFDPEQGKTLQDYAYKRVHGAMLDAICNNAPRGYRRKGKTGKPIPVGVFQYQDYDGPSIPDIESQIDLARLQRVIDSKRFKARERKILVKRTMGEELRPLAVEYGISRTRVSQIHKESVEKLRGFLEKKKARVRVLAKGKPR